VIRLTFKGDKLLEVVMAIEYFLQDIRGATPSAVPKSEKPKVAGEVPERWKEKPKPDAAERMAKARAAKAKKKTPESIDLSVVPKGATGIIPKEPEPEPEPASEPPSFEDVVLEDVEPEPEAFDPSKLTALRVKTTEELQAAYSSGKHKQVLALLSKYGNGAKSFRELQIQDFISIRKAIDEGALA